MNWMQRVLVWASTSVLTLARVSVVAPGRAEDGLVASGFRGLVGTAGTELDKTWADLSKEFGDAREAWRRNPLARRLVSLVSSFVCGDGITLTSDLPDLGAFLAEFWAHPQNHMALRQYGLCEELSRSGELFITLHMNPVDGMSYVRSLPASSIDKVLTVPGDYETEIAYHEMVGVDDPDYPDGRTWKAAGADDVGSTRGRPGVDDGDATWDEGRPRVVPTTPPAPICLHFAVNRPAGCVRGESDLAPVLPWLQRYSRWLEDRTMLNAAVRAFLWVIKVPGTLVEQKKLQWSRAPEPGSVLVLDKDNEDWQAVAPQLHAADAQADGRAIRWMIVAGGPGVGLVDMGEGEEANLATAKAMGEQRSRFMRARQQYFAWALATTALTAYNRAVRLGKLAGEERALGDIRTGVPDISPADNAELGTSAAQVASALASVSGHGIQGKTWQRLVVRTVMKFAGEPVEEAELGTILAESRRGDPRSPGGARRAN